MPVEIREGFLLLHSATGPTEIEAVKGSAILRVRKINQNSARTTLVTLSGDGFSIEVKEEPIEILEAVTASYKGVMRK